MKKTAIVLFVLFSLIGNIQPVEAQFWKKLGKRVEEAAKETVIRKVEEKTVQKTENTIDTIFEAPKKIRKKKNNKKNKSKTSAKENQESQYNTSEETVANTMNSEDVSSDKTPLPVYNFTHRYRMEMIDRGKTAESEYLLIENGDYLGVNMTANNQDMISIMDIKKQTFFMLMQKENDKTMMSIGLNFETVEGELNDNYDFEIKKTEHSKQILGYNCTEYKVKGKDFYSSIWMTTEAGITFPKSFYRMKNKRFNSVSNKGMDNTWIAKEGGIALEMEITDTSKRKPKTIIMRCVELEKKNFSIDTTEYEKLF